MMSLTIYLNDPTATYEVHSLWEGNITSNLARMANEAGLYECLWDTSAKSGSDLIYPLKEGLSELKHNQAYYEKFNPNNGWGSYETLLEYVTNLLAACEKFPLAKVYTHK